MARRLVQTSEGWLDVTFSEEQRFASLALLDDAGWVVREDEWNDLDYGLADAIAHLGVPESEAVAIAEQTEAEWLTRGGIPPGDLPRWEGLALVVGVLIATVGVWLAGVAFLVWLVVRLVT